MSGATLRQRIHAGETLIGTFVKTPTPHVVEILGLAGLDFAVADQEHAPIGLAEMDMLSMAARTSGLPLLSRRWAASTLPTACCTPRHSLNASMAAKTIT